MAMMRIEKGWVLGARVSPEDVTMVGIWMVFHYPLRADKIE